MFQKAGQVTQTVRTRVSISYHDKLPAAVRSNVGYKNAHHCLLSNYLLKSHSNGPLVTLIHVTSLKWYFLRPSTADGGGSGGSASIPTNTLNARLIVPFHSAITLLIGSGTYRNRVYGYSCLNQRLFQTIGKKKRLRLPEDAVSICTARCR